MVNKDALQFTHTNYYSSNVLYTSIIRSWYNKPIWAQRTKEYNLTSLLQVKNLIPNSKRHEGPTSEVWRTRASLFSRPAHLSWLFPWIISFSVSLCNKIFWRYVTLRRLRMRWLVSTKSAGRWICQQRSHHRHFHEKQNLLRNLHFSLFRYWALWVNF
jgi:hypothetical protein